jgi:hypothetical protein
MTISQALRRIAKLKGSIAEHSKNCIGSITYNVAKPPVFSFNDEFSLMEKDKEEMLDLQTKVAVANAVTYVQTADGDVMPLVKAIKVLEEVKGLIKFYSVLPIRNEKVKEKEPVWNEEKSQYVNLSTEVEYKSDLTELERVAFVNSLKDKFEELNNLVEDMNHKTEI